VDAFEREFAEKIGVGQGAALSSGTAALHIALRILRVSDGDEVVTSTFTFAATVNAILYLGGEPVLIDSNRETWNMDPGLLAEELEACASRGKLPKAVIVVDLYGQCADHDPILEACARYEVPVIEDSAEALGATYRGRAAGSLGGLGVFSFNGNKIITTSWGECWSRSGPNGSNRPASYPHRHATRRLTTSTPPSGTTIDSATCSPPWAGAATWA
jgi:dTDP-4-amino-4,6-dideoxygalactose transaminase